MQNQQNPHFPSASKSPAPCDLYEGIVHSSTVRAFEEAACGPGVPEDILVLLERQRDNMRAAQHLVRQSLVLQHIQLITRLREQRWIMCEHMMVLAGTIGIHKAEGDPAMQSRIRAAVDDVKALLHNTRYTRDAFYDCILMAARGVEEERGSREATLGVERFYEMSLKYMEELAEVHTTMENYIYLATGGRGAGMLV